MFTTTLQSAAQLALKHDVALRFQLYPTKTGCLTDAIFADVKEHNIRKFAKPNSREHVKEAQRQTVDVIFHHGDGTDTAVTVLGVYGLESA